MTRTLEMWIAFREHTSRENVADYFIIGNIISTDLIDYIRVNMPLETDKPDYIQISAIQGYYYDFSRALKPVYHTFSAYNNQWRYHGICFKWESISRS